MADKILTCQQPDGLWRASLLDPDSYPLKETSGSGFYTYALAWGVNQGFWTTRNLPPPSATPGPRWWPVWRTMANSPMSSPSVPTRKNSRTDATEVYGVGAFLLAGSEVYRLAVLAAAKPLVVNVANPAAFWRENETVEVTTHLPSSGLTQQPAWAVMDGLSARILDSQACSETSNALPEKLLFQVDLAPGETRTFYVLDAAVLAAVPPPIVKTMARYVPERYDDFAWESDRIAHRAYGQALIPVEDTITSGPDVWIKKDRRLIVDVMYATKHYHEDNGEFMDDYRVGHSCGCGGLGDMGRQEAACVEQLSQLEAHHHRPHPFRI